MGWGAAVRIELTDAERSELQARARRRKIARADAMRAEIVLLAADGMTNLAIAARLGITRVTVAMWRRRFAAKTSGRPGRCAPPGGSAPDRRREDRRGGDDDAGERPRRRDALEHPFDGGRAGVAEPRPLHSIWRAFVAAAAPQETFKLSTDPLFVEKVRDIVGLYLDIQHEDQGMMSNILVIDPNAPPPHVTMCPTTP